MKILIRNYLSCSYLLEQEPNQWDAIVILDANFQATDFVANHTRRHLFLYFDDVTDPNSPACPASADDIAQALKFAEGSTNLVVSCRAGQSRSAALAFSIAYRLVGPQAAVSLWDPKRHSPNHLVLDLAAQQIEDADFMRTYERWLQENRGIKMTDYLDEIEAEFDQLESAGAKNRILN